VDCPGTAGTPLDCEGAAGTAADCEGVAGTTEAGVPGELIPGDCLYTYAVVGRVTVDWYRVVVVVGWAVPLLFMELTGVVVGEA